MSKPFRRLPEPEVNKKVAMTYLEEARQLRVQMGILTECLEVATPSERSKLVLRIAKLEVAYHDVMYDHYYQQGNDKACDKQRRLMQDVLEHIETLGAMK